MRASMVEVMEELGWDTLNNGDWKLLEGIKALLEPFAKYTTLVSGENYVTISSVIPILIELSSHLNEVFLLLYWHI